MDAGAKQKMALLSILNYLSVDTAGESHVHVQCLSLFGVLLHTQNEWVSIVLRCRPVGFFSIYYYYHLQGDWYFKSVSVIFVPFLGVSICLRRISFSIDQNDLALFRVILQAFSLAANTKVTITLEVKCEIEDMLKCKKGKLQTNCSQNVSALSINDFGQLSKSWITAKLLWKHRFECWSYRHRYFRDCCSRCQMIK